MVGLNAHRLISLTTQRCTRGDTADDVITTTAAQKYFYENNAEPIWKISTAKVNAKTVLNPIEKRPHFQDPDSLTIQTTATEQGE